MDSYIFGALLWCTRIVYVQLTGNIQCPLWLRGTNYIRLLLNRQDVLVGSTQCYFCLFFSWFCRQSLWYSRFFLSYKQPKLSPGTNPIWCVSACVWGEKVNQRWRSLISLCDFHTARHVYITHYSITSDNRTRGVCYLETLGYDKKNSQRVRQMPQSAHRLNNWHE